MDAGGERRPEGRECGRGMKGEEALGQGRLEGYDKGSVLWLAEAGGERRPYGGAGTEARR